MAKSQIKQSLQLAKPDSIPFERWMTSVEKYVDAWCEVNGYIRNGVVEFMVDNVAKLRYPASFYGSMPYFIMFSMEHV